MPFQWLTAVGWGQHRMAFLSCQTRRQIAKSGICGSGNDETRGLMCLTTMTLMSQLGAQTSWCNHLLRFYFWPSEGTVALHDSIALIKADRPRSRTSSMQFLSADFCDLGHPPFACEMGLLHTFIQALAMAGCKWLQRPTSNCLLASRIRRQIAKSGTDGSRGVELRGVRGNVKTQTGNLKIPHHSPVSRGQGISYRKGKQIRSTQFMSCVFQSTFTSFPVRRFRPNATFQRPCLYLLSHRFPWLAASGFRAKMKLPSQRCPCRRRIDKSGIHRFSQRLPAWVPGGLHLLQNRDTERGTTATIILSLDGMVAGL